jgi:hypothetical protein
MVLVVAPTAGPLIPGVVQHRTRHVILRFIDPNRPVPPDRGSPALADFEPAASMSSIRFCALPRDKRLAAISGRQLPTDIASYWPLPPRLTRPRRGAGTFHLPPRTRRHLEQAWLGRAALGIDDAHL